MNLVNLKSSPIGKVFYLISLFLLLAHCGVKYGQPESQIEFATFEQQVFYLEEIQQKAEKTLRDIQEFSIIKKVHQGIYFDAKVVAESERSSIAKNDEEYIRSLKVGQCVDFEAAKNMALDVFSSWTELLAKSEKENRVALSGPLIPAQFNSSNPDVTIYFICTEGVSAAQYFSKNKFVFLHLKKISDFKNRKAVVDQRDAKKGFSYMSLAHEIGHIFGLTDTYRNPPRNTSNWVLGQSPRSIMNVHYLQANITFEDQLALTWLYQRHMYGQRGDVPECPGGYQYDSVSKGCIFGWSGYEDYLPYICSDAGGRYDNTSKVCTCETSQKKYTIDLLSGTMDCFYTD